MTGKRLPLKHKQIDEISRRLGAVLDRWSGVGHTVEAARLHIEAEFLQELCQDHGDEPVLLEKEQK